MYRARKFIRRHTLGVSVSALLVLVLVLGIVGTSLGMIRARVAERAAAREAETARQISDFLVNLFEVSDPSEALGETITAREILDKGAGKIEKELGDQPEVQVRLMSTMGNVYNSLGLYEKAFIFAENTLRISKSVYGEEHIDTIKIQNALSSLLIQKGMYEEAEPLIRKNLSLSRKVLGNEHISTADCLNNLANLLLEEGEFTEAERFYREALELRRRLLGNEHAVTLSALWQRDRLAVASGVAVG